MAKSPWRVSFPIVVNPATGREHIAVVKRDIPDARGPHVLPTMCYIIGPDRDGTWYKFVVSIHEHDRAARAPLHFVECDTIRGPSGEIVDAAGKVFDPENHDAIEQPKKH